MPNDTLYTQAAKIAKKITYIKKNLKPTTSSTLANVFYFKIIRPTLRLYYTLFKLFNTNTPWTSQASITFFKQALTKEMTGFEYGSGMSTKFFATKLKNLVSLEHDSAWYSRVKEDLQKSGISNISYHLVEKVAKKNENQETISLLGDTHVHTFTEEFLSYSGFITRYPDEHFDFILVDGRARVDCILRSIPKLKPGGVLVLDNSERERYDLVYTLLKTWPVVFTTTGYTDTTLWFKPTTL